MEKTNKKTITISKMEFLKICRQATNEITEVIIKDLDIASHLMIDLVTTAILLEMTSKLFDEKEERNN